MLRAVRKLAGISGEDLAARLGVSQSKVSRIELGQVGLTPDLASRWAEACGGNEDRTGEIVSLAERVATEASPFPSRWADGITRFQHKVAGIEMSARLTLNWHPRLVPGLLQTPAYAREIFACAYPEGPELSQAVAARMARQAVLYDPSRTIRMVFGEAALRWPIATVPTLVAQLDRLALFAADGTVQFGIVPFDAPFGAFSYHGWIIRAERDDDEPDLVEVEVETAEVNIIDPAQTAAYRAAFEQLAAVAVYGDETAALIRRVRAELADREAL